MSEQQSLEQVKIDSRGVMKTHQIQAEHFMEGVTKHCMARSVGGEHPKALYAILDFAAPGLIFQVCTREGKADYSTISEAVNAYNAA